MEAFQRIGICTKEGSEIPKLKIQYLTLRILRWFSSSLETTRGRVSELEDRAVGNIHTQSQKKRKNEKNTKRSMSTARNFNICVNGVPEKTWNRSRISSWEFSETDKRHQYTVLRNIV